MGDKYIESTFEIIAALKETSLLTPIFFVLLPGIDLTNNVENLGVIMGNI